MAYFKMNGSAVFEFAAKQGDANHHTSSLEESGTALKDVDWFMSSPG